MGASASLRYKYADEAAALAAGKTQDEIDLWKSSNPLLLDGVEYIDMADITLGKKLGNGAFGDVLQVKLKLHPPGGQIIVMDAAVKMIKAEYANDLRARADIIAENERLKQCDSPFVTRSFGRAKDPTIGCLYIVLELCDLGDLKGRTNLCHWDILPGSRMCPVPHAEMIIITLHMLLGLAYVHSKGMVHRDIAARNIMLKTGPGGTVMALLADLGMTREVGPGGYYSLKYTLDGDVMKIPAAWSPPESFKMQESESKDGDKKYTATRKLDLWAVAVTLYEMVTNCSGGEKPGPYLAEETVHQLKTINVRGADGKKVEMEVVVDHLADASHVRDFIADKKDKATGKRTPGTGERLHIPESCPLLLRVIIEALWSGDPASRPDAVQVILFITQRCALLTEAPQWDENEESAAKIKGWLVDDLGIPVPRALEMFAQLDYEVLVNEDPTYDFKNMLGDAGAEYVCSNEFKALRRELTALRLLNTAMGQEPLKNALAKACEEAQGEEDSEATQASLSTALETARAEAAVRRAAEAKERPRRREVDENEGKGDDGDDDRAAYGAAVPLSPFSLAITAQIDAEEAKGADRDFALMGQLEQTDLPAARALDIAAHKAQVACEARKVEADAQLVAAMKKKKNYERCGVLQGEAREAAAQLEAATDARARAWAAGKFPGRVGTSSYSEARMTYSCRIPYVFVNRPPRLSHT
jgi:serine/threonine protein kinase